MSTTDYDGALNHPDGDRFDHGSDDQGNETHLAIVGLACRFPGAATPEEYWENLVTGRDCVRPFTAEELADWGHDPAVLDDPRYVPMHGIVDGVGEFDADFFQFSTRDATLLNPQHRFFLECAWEALERAGYDPRAVPGTVGVYAGAGRNGYPMLVQAQADRFPGVDDLALAISNEPEHLATRVSYKLGLTGPSMAVLTACSSSLVAVHEAGRALLAGDCDVALAGGVTLRLPHSGYRHLEGGTMSPDGRCRTFSADAKGIVGGDGAGVVVLRRLQDALDDGDHVHAVIRGSAVNNDGHERAGFTAPGVAGQREVIRLAHLAAEAEPASISYVEAHGTGTPVGDPIEVSALADAFRGDDGERLPAGSVLLGSVKTNIGHTDTAAGVAGLIKTALALQHRTVPPTLHFTAPNPVIDFATTPFAVNSEARDWASGDGPRRAGVSSFGIGGTNAHVVLEEAPAAPEFTADQRSQLLVLSARTPSALAAASRRLAEHLSRHPELDLAEVAWTLQVGRHAFAHRRYLVCDSTAEAVAALSTEAVATISAGATSALSAEATATATAPTGDLADLLGLLDRLHQAADAERPVLLDAVGRHWQQGAEIDWTRLHGSPLPRRVPLPTYPFERRTLLVKPEPFQGQPTAAPAVAEPQPAEPVSGGIADRLALLFGKVLGADEDFGARDFFELGGDSLTAVQLISLVEDEFGVAPELEAVFDHPTVPELASVITELLDTLHATAAGGDDPREAS